MLHTELVGFNNVRSTEILNVRVGLVMSATTEPSTFGVETNEKFNKVKSPAADQTLAEFIQAGGEI